jgi:ABC-2 type transport system permease protein
MFDRVQSSWITMTAWLAVKLTYRATLPFLQLILMFVWAWTVSKLDFIPHILGFVVMGVSTAFAVPQARSTGRAIHASHFLSTKVFWRDEPVSQSLASVLVLLAVGAVLFVIARKLAERWA